MIVDASVAIKWAIGEADHEAALPLLEQELVVPDIFFAEVANVLWKKAQRGEIAPEEAREAAALIAEVGYEVIGMRSLLADALDLALEIGHPTYDLFYVALARARRLPFVTADRRLVQRIAALTPRPGWAELVRPLLPR